jgi:hypothetical protein
LSFSPFFFTFQSALFCKSVQRGLGTQLAHSESMDAKLPLHPTKITVIADNPETLEGLRHYLSGVGVVPYTARTLNDLDTLSCSMALVLFPDGFGTADVTASVASIRAAHPQLLILFVTSAPQLFSLVLGPDNESLLPIVLPKPVFGWTILDTIRARLEFL